VKKVAFAVLLSWQVLHADSSSIRVVNGASFVSGASFTPGALVSIFGDNLTNTTVLAPSPSSLPETLGGVTVSIRGNPLSLFFVAPTQINAIIPSIPPGPATLTVTSPTGSFRKDIVLAPKSAPGLFSLFGTGTRDGAIENATAYALGPYTVTTNGVATPLAIFMTGLDLSEKPTVTIGGILVPLTFYGAAPCCTGVEQVNIQLTPALAGAGRVELAVTSHGNTSNVVEVVILPSPGQAPYGPSAENTARSREISSIAYVPHTSLALVADENDDVIRVINAQSRAVTGVVTLPEGAQPVAVAVNDAGAKAVVAERNRGKIAIIDVANARVSTELTVGGGPGSVAIGGSTALVVNQDTDSVSLVDLVKGRVTATVPVGRGPRGVAVDATASKAYVTNQDDGTVSIIDLANPLNTAGTIQLPANARPAAIQLVTGMDLAVITDPTASASGRAYILSLGSGAISTVLVNSGRDGGSNSMASYAGTVYFANQTGGSIGIAQFTPSGAFTSTTIKTDLGTRAIAVDTLDGLLLAANEGGGTVAVANLTGTEILGRINAMRGPGENGRDLNNHDDRTTASNAPTLTSMSPSSASGGSLFTVTINGTNLQNASNIFFVDPSTLPGHGNGRTEGESGDEHWHGPFGANDGHITVSNIVANQAGNQLTATVTISGTTPRGVPRVVRVETPNGDTSFAATSANTFHVN
jgi:uncharacterized protein (TIGR03437 family)